MRRIGLVTAAALMATPLVGLPAWGATCVVGTVASYVALDGGGCTVDGVTFSNVQVNTSVSPGFIAAGGSLILGNITPITFVFNGVTEFGLSLNYQFFTPAGQFADIAWTYNVAGNLLTDAFLSVTGQTQGNGLLLTDETLSNGVLLTLNGAGTTTAVFAPIGSLFVTKDHLQIGGSIAGSFASSSILINAWSLNQIPLPGALPLFATGLGAMGLLGWRRKRKTKAFA